MKTYRLSVLNVLLLLLISASCTKGKKPDEILRKRVEEQLKDLTQKFTRLEHADSLETFMQYYDDHAISMPEYQLTLRGRDEIKSFYLEIFNRQKNVTFHRTTKEFIHMDSAVVEIGTFEKEYTDSKTDSLLRLEGKYWFVWEAKPDSKFKLKAEAFGYFHPVEHPERLVVSMNKRQPDESEILSQRDIPFELKAYNALMEKGVRKRDGDLRSEFFMKDGAFYPFADTAVTGMDQIKPYLLEYSSRGAVAIDSIMCYTYDFETLGEYVLEYDMFKVKWSVPNYSGRTEGKGIRIWKRQQDKSLRLYREIGTHNHLQ